MVRRLAVLCATALIACSAACSGDEPASVPTSSATPSPTPTPSSIISSKPTPTTPPRSDPEVACGGDPFNLKKVRPYNPGGPAYAGRGIHPAFVVSSGEISILRLPKEWDASYGGKEPATAQLVVCQYVDQTYRSTFVENCKYEGPGGTTSTVKLLSARYKYRVFETRTARPVVTFTLMGSVNGCPATLHGGEDDVAYEYVFPDDLAAKLRPFVVGPARR